jgi:predicted anti-sigma-YlaC factor YlaD
MNHQIYEEWLFYDPDNPNEQLSDQEKTQLLKHIEGCPSCRLLLNSWNEVKVTLDSTPQKSPEPGFTGRWLERLDTLNQKENRRQALRVFLYALIGTSIILIALATLLWPVISSPNIVFWSVYDRFINLYSLFYIVLTSITTLFNTSMKFIPVSFWIFMIGIVFELGVIWIVSYRALTHPRRITP